MGRINKIYPYTKWRPTRVFWSDNLWEHTVDDVKEHLLDHDYDFYCRRQVIEECTGDYVPRQLGRDGATWQTDPFLDVVPDKVHIYRYCTEHSPNRPDPTSWRADMEEGVFCKFGGSFQVALMHGVEEGFDPIYVVGADLGITPGGMGETRNHFSNDYQVMEYDQRKADGKNRAYALAHSMAREHASERGIQIYNAGIGGELAAYERVDFESLF